MFYFMLKDTASFFFGSVTLAYAIQHVNLHRRVALLVLTLVGSSAKWFVKRNV
jgi:sodium-dependent dicarboxylate transporter 2/3/5